MMVKFREYDCRIKWRIYGANGRIRIDLVDAETGEPIAVATVNIVHVPLEDNEVIVKDYNENKGMAKVLEEAGVATYLGDRVALEHVDTPIMVLTPKAILDMSASTRTLSLSS